MTLPPAVPLPLGHWVEIRPPVGPNGWAGYHYPAGDPLQIAAYLDPDNRRVHITATHRPWTSTQARHIAELLTHLAGWLDDLPDATQEAATPPGPPPNP